MVDDAATHDPMQDFSARLKAHFCELHQRAMADLPASNPALSVACVGFRRWGDSAFGIVVAPWTINVILAPLPPDGAPLIGPVGAAHAIALPCGVVEFRVADLAGLGLAHMRVLVSDMDRFVDQQSAETEARATLARLLGETEPAVAPKASVESAPLEPPTEPAKEKPVEMDRRAFFRRAFGAGKNWS
jgi:[NiFe] hydrogenase assembly HybE family chaperone